MEIRRLADVLLRSQASPLPTFLVPSVLRSPNLRRCRGIGHREFTKSATNSAATPANARVPAPTAFADRKPSQVLSKGAGESSSWRQSLSSPNRFQPGSAQRKTQTTQFNAGRNNEEKALNGGSSAEDLLSAFSMQNASRGQAGTPTDADMYGLPANILDKNPVMPPQLPLKTPLRLNPAVGRTVHMGAGIDIARGFRLLEQSCGRNRVRADFQRQMFHERGGLKRKRLRRERWRKRFMGGFRATVNRVKELKTQGW